MEKRIKVGLFVDTFFPMVDGVIMVVDNYARRLSKTCDVTVFAPKGRKKFDDSQLPYKVVRCGVLRLFFLNYDLPMPNFYHSFMKAVESSDLDIVHIHSPFTIGKVGQSYAKKHNIPCVATMHSQYKQDFKRALLFSPFVNLSLKIVMKVFNDCDECWSVNNQISKIFLEYGSNKKPITHNNGTEFVLYENKAHVQELREKYGIADNEKVFLFVGRITELKNVFFIVDVLKILAADGFAFKMIYVGEGLDEKELQEKILDNDLNDKIKLVGLISDRQELSAIYRMADLFVFPSLYDASSLVQIEAAAQKTPTIFIRGAATASTITENVNGYLAENDPVLFANKIKEIFADPVKYQETCENAYETLFVSWDKAVNRAKKDYLRLIEMKKEEK